MLGWEAPEEQLYTGRLLGLWEEAVGGENTAPNALELTSADRFTGVWTQTKSRMCQQCGKWKRLTKAGNLPAGITTSYFSVTQMSTYFLIKPKSTEAETVTHVRAQKSTKHKFRMTYGELHTLPQNITSKAMGNWVLWMTQGWGHGKSHSDVMKPSKH